MHECLHSAYLLIARDLEFGVSGPIPVSPFGLFRSLESSENSTYRHQKKKKTCTQNGELENTFIFYSKYARSVAGQACQTHLPQSVGLHATCLTGTHSSQSKNEGTRRWWKTISSHPPYPLPLTLGDVTDSRSETLAQHTYNWRVSRGTGTATWPTATPVVTVNAAVVSYV